MKLMDLFENQDIEIVGFDIDETSVQGIHKLSTVDVQGDALIKAFGEPQDFSNKEQSDINYIWSFTINFREAGEDYEGDHDIAFAELYDYRYGDDQEVEPAGIIDEWTIGGRNWMDGYVLRTLLEQKGILA